MKIHVNIIAVGVVSHMAMIKIAMQVREKTNLKVEYRFHSFIKDSEIDANSYDVGNHYFYKENIYFPEELISHLEWGDLNILVSDHHESDMYLRWILEKSVDVKTATTCFINLSSKEQKEHVLTLKDETNRFKKVVFPKRDCKIKDSERLSAHIVSMVNTYASKRYADYNTWMNKESVTEHWGLEDCWIRIPDFLIFKDRTPANEFCLLGEVSINKKYEKDWNSTKNALVVFGLIDDSEIERMKKQYHISAIITAGKYGRGNSEYIHFDMMDKDAETISEELIELSEKFDRFLLLFSLNTMEEVQVLDLIFDSKQMKGEMFLAATLPEESISKRDMEKASICVRKIARNTNCKKFIAKERKINPKAGYKENQRLFVDVVLDAF